MFAFAVLLALGATVSAYPRSSLPAYLNNPKIDTNGSWRIVGGENAAPGEFPFIVSLRGSGNNHFCGGSIINPRSVLTAAHCLIGASPSQVFAVAGTNTLNSGGVTIGSQSLIINPDYDDETIANDVGVVLLQGDFAFSNLIAPVELSNTNVGSVPATLSGWGVTGVDEGAPNDLQRLSTQTIENSVCQLFWGSSVASTQICILSPNGQGACFGDSGGPLIDSNSRVQLGTVSFGVACAVGFPDVFARVSAFNSWINSVSA
uniref:Serine protease 1 n=1 Tax=Holotrichia oblita TaxID=644536 RepID=E6Y8M8_HOLOL|nr:serine protease 1 [Holotrichia oblita]